MTSEALNITVTILLVEEVTKALSGSRGGGQGPYLLMGEAHGSGRACLGNIVCHMQKTS